MKGETMKQQKFSTLTFIAVMIAAIFLGAQDGWSQGNGKGGGKGGSKGGGDNGGGDEPSLNLPPILYAVDSVEIYGLSQYYDTNDYGVSAVSMHTAYANEAILTTSNKAAAIAHLDGTLEFLDNRIDPQLPYDLQAAIGINNAGQVYCVGFDGVSGDLRSFLLTRNPNAAADGFDYLVDLFPIPDLGEGWTYRVIFTGKNLTEAGDVLYKIVASSTDGTSRTLQSIRHADGTIEQLPDAVNEYSAQESFTELNSARTLFASSSTFDGTTNSFGDYLLFEDGSTQAGISRESETFIDDLADNGFICAQFAVAVGEEKVKGKWRTIWEHRAHFADPLGTVDYTTLRSGMDRSAALNEQLIGGKPPLAGGNELNTWLVYPGYDPAFLSELMADDAELTDFNALFHWENPADSFKVMTTPRNSDSTVDDMGAPSFYGALEYVTYPDGSRGRVGFYAIYPIVP